MGWLRLLLVASVAAAPAGPRLAYLYDLSTPTGPVRSSASGLWFDPAASELYVLGYGRAVVFNAQGMEVYAIEDAALGPVTGVVALPGGDLVVLSSGADGWALRRATFRGEPLGPITVTGLPAPFEVGFRPNRLELARDHLYVVDEASMKVAILEPRGAVVEVIDLAEEMGLADRRQGVGLGGVAVASDGTLYATLPPLFQVVIRSATGARRTFGQPGGAPGKFNVIAGIAVDAQGTIYVADSLKCAVIVFDRDLSFVGEFGYRGLEPGRLIAPSSVAVGADRLFVAQGGSRGVSVFGVRRMP
jgi:DNA-binding beta-propeller fold protein YncE